MILLSMLELHGRFLAQAAVEGCLLFRRCQGVTRHPANAPKMTLLTNADIALEKFIERFKRCRGL